MLSGKKHLLKANLWKVVTLSNALVKTKPKSEADRFTEYT